MSTEEKKLDVLTVRVTTRTKAIIQKEAKKREWTLSKMSEKILSTWAEEQEKEADKP